MCLCISACHIFQKVWRCFAHETFKLLCLPTHNPVWNYLQENQCKGDNVVHGLLDCYSQGHNMIRLLSFNNSKSCSIKKKSSQGKNQNQTKNLKSKNHHHQQQQQWNHPLQFEFKKRVENSSCNYRDFSVYSYEYSSTLL